MSTIPQFCSTWADELRDEYQGMPQHILESINAYVREGRPPGGFLTGMLTNDMRKAMTSDDLESLKYIRVIFLYLYNRIPATCWGSVRAYEDHLKVMRQPRGTT